MAGTQDKIEKDAGADKATGGQSEAPAAPTTPTAGSVPPGTDSVQPLPAPGRAVKAPGTGEKIKGESGDVALSSVTTDAGDGDALVEVTEDVFEEFYYPDTKRPSYRLLLHKGQIVKKSELEALTAKVNK